MQELSLNILDITENSVRAQARLIQIKVVALPELDELRIEIEDDGKGMDEKTARGAMDPFYTTRTTRKVGLGLPYLKMNAELTEGGMKIYSAQGKGTRVSAVFGLRHIDRAPLGDMGQTVALLAGANPELDFVYTLEAVDEKFIFDTREIKSVLDDVSVSEPEVVAYMTSYINDGTKALITKYGI
jgi:hypothetical protein